MMPTEKSTLTLLRASLSMHWVSPLAPQCHAAWHGAGSGDDSIAGCCLVGWASCSLRWLG